MPKIPKKNISDILHDVRPPVDFTGRQPQPAPIRNIAAAIPHVHQRVRIDSAAREEKISLIHPRPPSVLFGPGGQAVAGTPARQALLGAGGRIAYAEASKDEPSSTRLDSARLEFIFRQPVKSSAGVILGRGKKHWGLRFGLAALVLISVGGIFYAVVFRDLKNQGVVSARLIYSDLINSVEKLKDLRPDEARLALMSADGEFKNLKIAADRTGVIRVGEFLGGIFPVFQNLGEKIGSVDGLFDSAIKLSNALSELKTFGFAYFFDGNGSRLLALLHEIDDAVGKLSENSLALMSVAKEFQNSSLGLNMGELPLGDSLGLATELYTVQDVLRQFILLLERENGFHLALFFQNPSEMRPSGGFIGSYADLFIKGGAIAGMDVRDIYDPDGQLDLKLVPPKPLQGATVRWGARDANWFFDFPTSAKKTLDLLQVSKMYSEKMVLFEGAIAINTDVIQSLLDITGPIVITEYGLELGSGNFLEEIQKEVEAGENKKLGKPKQILKDFTPLFLAALKALPESGKEKLFAAIESHVAKKDIQAYFRSESLEGFAVKYGLGGEAYATPDGLDSDYLAVVNANVAGGKTDIFINQEIDVKSVVDSDGIIHNKVSVARTHRGKDSKYSWYRATNQNYLRLYVPKNTELDEIAGASTKTVYPRLNYKTSGYREDAEVVTSESGSEFGKNVWDAWLNTPSGDTRTITFSYHSKEKKELSSGKKYTFVFDKQSGVRGGIDFEFEAPAGFKWLESDRPTYAFRADDPESRIVIELTLTEV